MADRDGETTFAGLYDSAARNALIGPDGEVRALRRQSLDVFRTLASRPGRVVSKEELLAAVWPDTQVTDDSLVQCVADIRRVLGDRRHRVLQTVPRRGYVLVPDAPPAGDGDAAPTIEPGPPTATATSPDAARRGPRRLLAPLGLAVALAVGIAFTSSERSRTSADGREDRQAVAPPGPAAGDAATAVTGAAGGIDDNGPPTLVLAMSDDDGTHPAAHILPELRAALSRYRTVRLVDTPTPDYRLSLHGIGDTDTARLVVELTGGSEAATLFADSYPLSPGAEALHRLGARVAAAIASPGVGAVGRHLLARSRATPVRELSPDECYAHGFGCAKCSGEEDNITRRAEACLAHLIEKNPDDARAWALQATIHAHQYWYGNTLAEPLRSDPSLRHHLPQRAIDAANRAESLSDGGDTAVYWGLVEAYMASCQSDKLESAARRGLELNPDDPNLLAAFGNWLAYSGKWDEGAALTERALEIEPRNYRRWWWMGIAKRHYFHRRYAEAHAAFLKAFNERNWLSHLQLAYTLPHLDRVEDARAAVDDLVRLYPGITLERAVEFYDVLCFPDSFLTDMRDALTLAGLPSRGDASDLDAIEMPRAETVRVNGIDIEYVDVGSGEPVLFVHGAISDYRTWSYFLVPISERHRYLSYSQRYFGTQPWADDGDAWGSDQFADDLIGLVEALDAGPVHLVTWSSGVKAAALAVVERPDLFKSVVHYEPVDDDVFPGDAEPPASSRAFYALWEPVDERLEAGDLEDSAQRMLELVFELGPGGFTREREMVKEIVRQNARTLPLNLSFEDRGDTKITCDLLGRTTVPTRIVYGTETYEHWTNMSRRFAACIPGSDLQRLEGANHRAPLDDVEPLTELVLEFVDAHRDTR